MSYVEDIRNYFIGVKYKSAHFFLQPGRGVPRGDFWVFNPSQRHFSEFRIMIEVMIEYAKIIN